MYKPIDEVEFTIFDTETTGLDPKSGDRIVEIAALKFRGGERIATFESLVNPGREISPAAFAVNKIAPEMLAGAPQMAAVMPKFLEFIRGSCLCSYNAAFDLEFLNQELKLLNQSQLSGVIVVDILKMARRILPGLKRYALWFVIKELGIQTAQVHRAFSDVELTFQAFQKLNALLKTKSVPDFNNFTGLFSITPELVQDIHEQKIAQIQEAIDLKVSIKMKYLSSTSAQVSEREVVPKEIRKERGVAYLVGYCCLKNDERHFRIDGILHLEIV